MNFNLYWRLSVMMLLQYWIWGAWGSYLPLYLDKTLGFTGDQIGIIMGMLYFSCLIAPFIGGQIADRFFNAEKFMGLAHFFGGIFLFIMAEYISFGMMLFFMFLYTMLYAPTIPLSNSVSFQNLDNVDRDFGKIRVWGTLGWIFAGWVLTFWLRISPEHIDPETGMNLAGANCLRLAGIASLILGVFSFWLPKTPPNKEGNPWAFLEALQMLKEPSFLIFMIISFIVATELMFYYILTAPFLDFLQVQESNIPAIMTIAQIAEFVTLLFLLPYFLPRIGIKWTIAIGIIFWPVRYVVFAIGQPTWLVIASLSLHGLCYVFFFVAGQIYVDKVSPNNIRSSAQSLLTIVTFGLGLTFGSLFTGRIKAFFTTEEAGQVIVNWPYIFMVPTALTIICAILFFLFFKEPEKINIEEVVTT